jgi:hypothetical protein
MLVKEYGPDTRHSLILPAMNRDPFASELTHRKEPFLGASWAVVTEDTTQATSFLLERDLLHPPGGSESDGINSELTLRLSREALEDDFFLLTLRLDAFLVTAAVRDDAAGIVAELGDGRAVDPSRGSRGEWAAEALGTDGRAWG